SWLSFSSQPRPRILQQPFSLSSCFSNLFPEKLFSTQPLAPSTRTSSLQRDAHSTAFKTAVNTSFFTAFDQLTEPPTGSNYRPVDRRAFYTPDSALQALRLT
ncbi:hypothetical protein ACNFCK_13585, partial [Pseudomonas sp. NY15366]